MFALAAAQGDVPKAQRGDQCRNEGFREKHDRAGAEIKPRGKSPQQEKSHQRYRREPDWNQDAAGELPAGEFRFARRHGPDEEPAEDHRGNERAERHA